MEDRVMGTWRITARDRNAQRQGVVDVYTKLSMVSRHVALGACVLEMSLDDAMVPYLVQPGAGIVVELDDVVQFSGQLRPVDVNIVGTDRTITFAGYDDLVALADRVASPQPATSAPPYSVSAYDVRSGVAETVIKAYVDANVGPGALAVRRKTGLTIAADSGRGATVTGRARWHNLLTMCGELAVLGGLGLRCRNLVFDVYQPVDRSATVEFSDDRESIGGIAYKREAPAATWVYVGGGGEGTARTIVEGGNSDAIADGWDRIEVFSDRRDTTDPTELAQAVTAALIGDQSSSTDRQGVTITPLDTAGTAYGTDYLLGDTVAWVDPWGTRYPLVVQAVTVELTAQQVVVTPTLGSIVPDIPAQFARLAALARRTARLEVR